MEEQNREFAKQKARFARVERAYLLKYRAMVGGPAPRARLGPPPPPNGIEPRAVARWRGCPALVGHKALM